MQPLFVMLLTLLLCLPAYAFDTGSFVLTGHVSTENGSGQTISYTLRLEAEDAEAEETLPETRTVTLNTEGDFAFGPFDIKRPGMYYYRLYEEKGSQKNVAYDDRTISIGILCTNREDGTGIEITGLVASKDNWKTKLDTLSFTNSYKAPSQETKTSGSPRVKTGDDLRAVLWLLLLGLSLAGAAALALIRRKRDEEE
ncbi:MAG: hypothetical protein II628_07485 [Lachnospiraceae bacterium]|nr:hypothetical protein [Lachnospiraceae bacterium]